MSHQLTLGECLVTLLVMELIFLLVRRYITKQWEHSAYFKGYSKGVEDAGESIHDLHYWFAGRGNTVLNTAFLIGHYLRQYKKINPARLRESLDRMGDRRYVDIPLDELKTYL